MPIEDPDLIPNVRLKYFLARQIDRPGKSEQDEMVSGLKAAILGALIWSDHYGGGTTLNQARLGRLFGITAPSFIKKLMDELKTASLVESVDEDKPQTGPGKWWYRITPAGREAAAYFADELLGVPEEVQKKLEEHAGYAVMHDSQRYVDEYLEKHFRGATATKTKKPRGERRGTT